MSRLLRQGCSPRPRNGGSPHHGTLQPAAAPGGGFDVSATHTFTEEGTLRASVRISDAVSSDTARGPALVLDAPLTITALPVAATEGAAFAGDVATFTDADPGGRADEYA